jgi:hypothetical protein
MKSLFNYINNNLNAKPIWKRLIPVSPVVSVAPISEHPYFSEAVIDVILKTDYNILLNFRLS